MTAETQANPFIAYLLTTLAALMAPTLGDPDLARRAAQQAIEAHQPQDARQQMTATQILAFAITALDTLRLSMPPDLSLSMKLKLRGNANALNRAARDNTKLLEQAGQTAEAQASSLAEPAAAMAAPDAEQPRTPGTDWATAMKTVAARLQAAPAVAPAQQAVNALWIESLTGTANAIAQAKQPNANRTNLLRTTLLASGQPFPTHLGHKRPAK